MPRASQVVYNHLPHSLQSVVDLLARKRVHLRKQRAHPHASLLGLPRELRDLILSYLIPIQPLQIPGPNTYTAYSPYQPPKRTGLLSAYGRPPPIPVLLINHQLCSESLDHFFRATTFEIGTLSPQHENCCFDPDYANLARSARLAQIRVLRFKIEITGLQMYLEWSSYLSFDSQSTTKWRSISLEKCVEEVSARARTLAEILAKGAAQLRTLMIVWEDSVTPAEMHDPNRALKFGVLEPFARLGVEMRFECERKGLVKKLEFAVEKMRNGATLEDLDFKDDL